MRMQPVPDFRPGSKVAGLWQSCTILCRNQGPPLRQPCVERAKERNHLPYPTGFPGLGV